MIFSFGHLAGFNLPAENRELKKEINNRWRVEAGEGSGKLAKQDYSQNSIEELLDLLAIYSAQEAMTYGKKAVAYQNKQIAIKKEILKRFAELEQ